MKQWSSLLLLSGILLGTTSCKKGNKNDRLSGTWQQTQLHISAAINGKVYDTTYYHPFTNLDYMQFKGDSCFISTDHYYYANTPGYPKTPQLITQAVGKWLCQPIGGKRYVLTYTSNLLNPGGFVSADTLIEISSNKMQLHVVSYGHGEGVNGITDSYFEKR